MKKSRLPPKFLASAAVSSYVILEGTGADMKLRDAFIKLFCGDLPESDYPQPVQKGGIVNYGPRGTSQNLHGFLTASDACINRYVAKHPNYWSL